MNRTRKMPPGHERAEALQKATILENAAEMLEKKTCCRFAFDCYRDIRHRAPIFFIQILGNSPKRFV